MTVSNVVCAVRIFLFRIRFQFPGLLGRLYLERNVDFNWRTINAVSITSVPNYVENGEVVMLLVRNI